MKLITRATGALAIVFMLGLLPVLSAFGEGTFEGVTSAKAVWDVTIGDEQKFKGRMDLIRQTAEMLRKRGIEPDFVVTIRGGATKFVTKSLAGTDFEKDKVKDMPGVQRSIVNLREAGVPVEVCAVAMSRKKVKPENVEGFAAIADNVWENLIVLQNKGYAYMPID